VGVPPLGAGEARARLDRVRGALGLVWDDLVALYEGRAWLALGHASWEALCDAELGGARVPASRLERREAVRQLRGAGMSTRAIGTALGASEATVRRDLGQAGASNDAVADRNGAPTVPGDTERTEAPLAPPAEPVPSAEPPRVVGLDGKAYPAARPAPQPDAAAAVAAWVDSGEEVRAARLRHEWLKWMSRFYPFPHEATDTRLGLDDLSDLDRLVDDVAAYRDRVRAAARPLRAVDGGLPCL